MLEKTAVPGKKMTAIWMIWGAMTVSLAVYVAICHLLIHTGYESGMDPDFPHELLGAVLFGFSLVQFVATYYLRRFLLKPGKREFQTPVGKYATAVMISCALAESIGIYGMVLFLLRPDFPVLYSFVGISAVAMFAQRPKSDELERLASDMEKFGSAE